MTALFPRFLDDPQEYLACQRYWASLVGDAARAQGQDIGDWPTWIPVIRDREGNPELDGNPIFDGFSHDLDRAFRVIQHPDDDDDDLAISAWLADTPEYAHLLPRHELVLNLSLSLGTSKLAASALECWMNPATSVEDMQSFIDRNFPEWTELS